MPKIGWERSTANRLVFIRDKNLRNLVAQFRFGQHSFANVVNNRNDASPSAKPSRGMKAKLVRANGGASASALAYDSWEEF
ncbi:hypothetical protein GR247_24305 [Rhizobium leguminosarum]|nr:hypothetical protein [Rhizobium leguminosarum]NKK56832.1 hypothetical protein [Rhizobium leguminosarum bv. viciae]